MQKWEIMQSTAGFDATGRWTKGDGRGDKRRKVAREARGKIEEGMGQTSGGCFCTTGYSARNSDAILRRREAWGWIIEPRNRILRAKTR